MTVLGPLTLVLHRKLHLCKLFDVSNTRLFILTLKTDLAKLMQNLYTSLHEALPNLINFIHFCLQQFSYVTCHAQQLCIVCTFWFIDLICFFNHVFNHVSNREQTLQLCEIRFNATSGRSYKTHGEHWQVYKFV